eukprot:XP_001705501.1 Hypothetical protein GL50803_19502 [Giardia lamblia ATCC 50803]
MLINVKCNNPRVRDTPSQTVYNLISSSVSAVAATSTTVTSIAAITSISTTTAAAAATTTSARALGVALITEHFVYGPVEPIRYGLFRVHHLSAYIFQGAHIVSIRADKRHCQTRPASAPCSTDPVCVVIDISRQVIVQNEPDVRDVQSSLCNVSTNEDVGAASLEVLEIVFPLFLGHIAMYDGNSISHIIKVPKDAIRL